MRTSARDVYVNKMPTCFHRFIISDINTLKCCCSNTKTLSNMRDYKEDVVLPISSVQLLGNIANLPPLINTPRACSNSLRQPLLTVNYLALRL